MTGSEHGRKEAAARPLLVVDGAAGAFDEYVRELRAAGWTVQHRWELDDEMPDGLVCASTVTTPEQAAAVVLAAAAGAGVVAHVHGDVTLVADLLEDLEQLGPVAYRSAPPRRLEPKHRDVLRLLGEGLTLAEVAERLFVSRRTVARRVAEAKAILGTAHTVRAVEIAAALDPPESG